MNILFAHNNFPGQFHRLSAELAADTANKVVFLSQYRRGDINAPGVIWRQVPALPKEEGKNSPRNKYLDLLGRGEVFGDAMVKLRKEGFIPDVIYGHVGFGCCLYAPDIFLDAAHVSYFEWYYTNRADTEFLAQGHPISLNTRAENRQSNMCILMALKEAHIGVCPTQWQRDQHPREYWHKLQILHEGVDTHYFTPAAPVRGLHLHDLELPDGAEVFTYATRGLEPYRGFPTFYRSLPAILEARPNAHAVIMANDRISYGNKRKDGKTWKGVMEDEVKLTPEQAQRVHFLPFQSYGEYRKLLQASACHVYLTVPFVLSWSMLEAMSCGCVVVASDTEPVREVLRHEANGILTPFWDHKQLAARVVDVLAHPAEYAPLRAKARRTIEAHYNLDQLLPRQVAMIKAAPQVARMGR